MALLSRRQLLTIKNFGNTQYRLHVGPVGCGKTYSMCMAFGMKLKNTPVSERGYAIIGTTQKNVKGNICNTLTSLFGDNFKYTNSTKDGLSKDALLFGHPIHLVGLKDRGSIDKIWGISLAGILGDEITKWNKDSYFDLLSRLRGELLPGEILWMEMATNPDGPEHWLKKYLDSGNSGIEYVQWTKEDVLYDGAVKYYNDLINRYSNSPERLGRYVYGQWTMSDSLIYPCFNKSIHVLSGDEVDTASFRYYNIAVDWGFDHPCAIVLCGTDYNGIKCIVKEVYLRETSMSTVVEQIVNLVNSCDKSVRNIWYDPSMAVLGKMLKEAGLRQVDKAVNDVQDGIDYVYDLFAKEELFICERCTNLLGEVATYGRDDKGKIVKLNDDGMDAVRYVLYTEKMKQGGF